MTTTKTMTGLVFGVLLLSTAASADDKRPQDKDGFTPMFDIPKFWIYNASKKRLGLLR